MEGTILEVAVWSSSVFMGGVALLGLVVSVLFFGYMAGEEKGGRRLTWAEWPLPETAVRKSRKVDHLRLAA